MKFLFLLIVISVSFYVSLVKSEHCHVINSRRLSSDETASQRYVDFIVALAVPNQDMIHNHLLDISNPKSLNYGRYLTLDEIKYKYGPKQENVDKVTHFFRSQFASAPLVELSDSGDMIKISAKAIDIEHSLNAELHIQECSNSNEHIEAAAKMNKNSKTDSKNMKKSEIDRKLTGETDYDTDSDSVIKRNKESKFSIRSIKPIVLPDHIKEHIAFVSLDLPMNYVSPKGKSHMASLDSKEKDILLRLSNKVNRMKNTPPSSSSSASSSSGSSSSTTTTSQKRKRDLGSITSINNKDFYDEELAYYNVFNASVTTGNEEAVLRFNVICGDGSWNQMNPPCANLEKKYVPQLIAKVTQHAELKANPFPLVTSPIEFMLTNDNIYCYNIYYGDTCTGVDGRNCTCITKLAPLPKYAQLRASIYAVADGNQDGIFDNQLIARSSLFALADVATIPFLADLYNMPNGLTVRHGKLTMTCI